MLKVTMPELHQYDRMTLRSRKKSKGDMAGENPLNSRQSTAAKQLARPALEMVSNYILHPQ